MTPIKRLPGEWEERLGILILDPDGWDRRNLTEDYNTPLTQEEFLERACLSTVQVLPGFAWPT